MTGRGMTDEQVRAELERIDPEMGATWDRSRTYDPTAKTGATKALRLLAASHRALGEIDKKLKKATHFLMKDSPRHPDGRSKEVSYFQDGMDRLMDARKIARTAWKGGK